MARMGALKPSSDPSQLPSTLVVLVKVKGESAHRASAFHLVQTRAILLTTIFFYHHS